MQVPIRQCTGCSSFGAHGMRVRAEIFSCRSDPLAKSHGATDVLPVEVW